ncbi:serine C-palmitoyltransferase [Martiniozyma asiatica (nom. inval.)]|nr:serine C-palmitoyltransferase [Martiniozyma asiatica]
MSSSAEESSQFLVDLAHKVNEWWFSVIEYVESIPGGDFIIGYIRASHKNDPWRTLLEVLLALVAIRYFLASRYNEDDTEKMKFSKKEVDELIDEWQPEPIVQPIRNDERWQLETNPEVKGAVLPYIKLVDPSDNSNVITNVMNLASLDFLGMSSNKTVKENSVKCIREVGVGACGPPNFYGTQSVHVRIREDLARFLGADDAILYGQDYSGVSSILPCFLKRGDVVIMDGGSNLSLQKSALISRCNIEWFDHNDLDHLEEILESLQDELKKGPLNRRFILTEGLSENFGDSPNLRRLVEIKNKYKFRLILDESNSIGTLGSNGRGLAEVYQIPRSEIEITIGSMARAFGSSGGFCAGDKDMIYHQILNSNGYVFSAALPPYCAVASSTVINLLENSEVEGQINPYIKPLAENNQHLYELFEGSKILESYIFVRSAAYSPSLHIRLHPKLRLALGLPESYGGAGSEISKAIKNGNEENYFDEKYNLESFKLQCIINECLNEKVLLTRTKRILHHELLPVVPELILHSNAQFSKGEIERAFRVTERAIISVLDAWKQE